MHSLAPQSNNCCAAPVGKIFFFLKALKITNICSDVQGQGIRKHLLIYLLQILEFLLDQNPR